MDPTKPALSRGRRRKAVIMLAERQLQDGRAPTIKALQAEFDLSFHRANELRKDGIACHNQMARQAAGGK